MTGSVIASGARTPIGRLLGSLKGFSGAQLGGLAIEAALERARISGDQVQYVIMGQVLQAGAGQIPSRQAAVADLDEAKEFYARTFDLHVVHEERNEEQGVREAMLAVGDPDGSRLQLLWAETIDTVPLVGKEASDHRPVVAGFALK